MNAPIALLEPDLPHLERLLPYFRKVADSGRYSNFGEMAVAFERRMGEHFFRDAGVPMYCVTCSSATMGMEIALQALRLPSGAKILVPAFGFVAVVCAVCRLGFEPVFADIDADTWELRPESAVQAIRQHKIKAVIVVSPFGYEIASGEWKDFMSSHGVPVILDVAAGLGNQSVASGLVQVFSLHATKAFGVGEGGLVVTSDADLANRMQELTNFGFHQRMALLIGANAKFSEWHAAIAHAQIDRWTEITRSRQALRDRYRDALAIDGLSFHPATWMTPIPNYLPVRMASAAAAESLVRILAEENIESRRWFWPALIQHPAYKDKLRLTTEKQGIRHAVAVAETVVCLPFHTKLSSMDIGKISELVTRNASVL